MTAVLTAFVWITAFNTGVFLAGDELWNWMATLAAGLLTGVAVGVANHVRQS
jgi:hypothetical protein